MIPNSECTNKHINKIQSNPSSFIDLNLQKTTPLNISVASNNSFRKKATQVFTTNTQVHKITETVSNFSQPTHRYATSSSILVNGEATTCLIDTGAFTSFISASYFKTRSLSLRPLTVKKQWITANGSPIHVTGETQLTLTFGALEITATFVIAKHLAHDLIIGVDILKPNRFIVNYDDNILTCQSVSVPIQSVTPVKTQLIHANSSIKLLPNTTDIIWVKCDLPNVNLLVNTCGRIKSTPTVVTMCTEGTHEHHIPIHLANTTPSAIHINRGDVIASVSEANILCSINSENDFDTFILRETNNFDTVNSITPSRPWKPSERIKNNNKNLTTDQKHALNRLIDEYYMVFARNDEDIGRIPDSYGTHEVHITSDIPIKQRPYNTPHAKERIVNESLDKMLKMKIIEPSDSDWASPIVLVRKPDGSERFCVDYRKLNAVTIKDSYPMPHVESKLNKLYACKFFTSLDCISGYWQIRLSERAKKLVAFTTTKGLYTFNFMPFGLCNANATFQRVIEKVIYNLVNSSAYVDDILTYSKTFDDHLIHLKALFDRLKTANIKIKTSKCHIASDNIMFLGYRITSDGVCIDDSRIKSLKNYPKPTKTKNVKEFLGLTGYYRQFIKNYADIVDPLNNLTRKNVKFTWCDKCDRSFQTLINYLSEKPILAFPNFDAPFYLSTDASQVGIGAVLSQKDEHQREHPVYFTSRSLTDAERRYSTIERELLAIIYSTEKFKYYLSGRKFTILTDHNPLVYLNSIKISSDRLTRWRLKLAEFDFNIVYKKGKANANADAMSRINIGEKPEAIKDDLHTLFSISPEPFETISDTQLFESLNSIIFK